MSPARTPGRGRQISSAMVNMMSNMMKRFRSGLVCMTATKTGLDALRPVLLSALLAGFAGQAAAQSISPIEIYEGETVTFMASRSIDFSAYGRKYLQYVDGDGSTISLADLRAGYTFASGDTGARVESGSESLFSFHSQQVNDFSFTITAAADAVDQDETLILSLRDYYDTWSFTAITLRDGARPVSATDGVTVSESSLALTEGHASDGEGSYTVVLDTDPGATVSIAVSSDDTSAATVSPSTLTFTGGESGTWGTAQKVTVTAQEDGDAAGETVTVSHAATVSSDSSNAYHQIAISDVSVALTDAGHGVLVSESSLAVNAGASATYKLRLKSQPGGSVIIAPTSSSTARATVSPATLTFTNADWDQEQTVTVTGADGASTGTATVSHAITTATSAYPATQSIASVTVAVTAVTPANTAPAFASDTLTRSVAENSASGTNVGAAIPAATDDDGDTITYTLEGTDAASFAFDASTRQITTATGVDYDHEAKSSYSVTVKADDGNGGTDTVAVTITVSDVEEPPTAPGAPTVSATAGSTTGLDVAWTAPANTGKPAITSYDLQYRAGSSGTWTNGPQDVATTSSAIAGLTAGTSYEVQVRATNAEGDSDWSASGSGTTNSPANTAPVFGSETLTRSVAENSASGTNVGAAIPAATDTDNDVLTYTLEGTDAASFAFDASTRQITTTTGVDYDHEAKSSYSVTVKADDGNGGTDTVAVTITVSDVDEPPTAPGAPTVSATAGTTTGLDVAWTAPANTGKPAIASYDLRYRAGSSGDWTNGPQDVATTSSALTGLTAGTSYEVQVRATNAEGDSGWSAAGTGTTSTPANRTPVVDNMIADQTATEGTAFSFAFPSNTFSDPDTGDTLTYTALLSDDSALPTWLTFTPATRTFSGTPAAADAGTLSIKVTASDGSLSAEDTFTLTVNALPVFTVSIADSAPESDGTVFCSIIRGGTQPASLTVNYRVSQTGAFLASGEAGDKSFSRGTGTIVNVDIALDDDSVDEPDGTVTCALRTGTGYNLGATSSDTIAIVDDDPTVVSLARVGTGPVTEGGTAEFTVTLGRALVAGETIDVPLSVSGTGVTTADWSLATKTGDGLNTGVTLSGTTTATPQVRFSGAGAQTATLVLTAVADGVTEAGGETITVELGPDGTGTNGFDRTALSTNVGGGADPHGTNDEFDLTVNDPVVPVVSIALPSVEGVSRNMAGQQVYEETGGPGGLTLSFDVSLTPAPSAAQSVCVRVTETGGSRIASTDKGVRTVSVPTTGSTALSLTWTDTAADDADSTITVEAVAPSDTACSQTGYTVSATDGSDEALVVDDDPTTVELTGSDLSMFEGDASDTAVLTVTLGRQLVAGEVVVAPLVLASTTGARLPGSTDGGGDPDNDFTVSVSGTGVALTGADSANPTLTFTGHDTNTVQTATVTLAPVANRDDGDSADEAITARLASNSVLSASGTDTNVGGGAARHATNWQASLTVVDDEGGGIAFSAGTLRLLETGSATYTVVLDAQPTANVTMTITKGGTNSGAANVSSTSHIFNTTNWNTAANITVTGVDQSNANANRELTLSHAFTSSDSRYGGMNRMVAVKVDDAPEVEAWEGWKWNHGALDPNRKMERPRTVTSTPGLSLGQDIVAGPLDYVIRLSNRPATGGTVTVTATVGDSNLAGISLTPNGTPQSSLTLTFSDRDPAPHCNNGLGNDGEDYDNTAESSWQCWRRVYVHDLAAGKTGVLGCTDITHTATGGGVRGMTGPHSWSVGTIRAHMMSQSRRGADGYEFRCPMITGKGSSPGMGSTSNAPLQVSGPPTEPVSNLQLAAVDASSAKATWDAVAGATGYRVEWEATDGLNAAAGVRDGVTETAFTIAHNMPAATSLTVKVLPEHVDGEGRTQALDALAGTAVLALGSGPSDSVALQDAAPQGPTEAALKACVSDELMATAERLYERNRQKPPHHAENWFSVLMAFGQRTPAQWTADNRLLTPMTAASARQRGWRRFGDALECLETAAPGVEVPSAEGDGDPLPSVRIAAGKAVTEGAAASFTLEVQPAPASDLAVTVEVAGTGAVLAAAALGTRTVTVPAGKTEAAFTVATADDDTDEPAGAVTATVAKGDGYAVDKENGGASATVAVADDDATAVALSAPAGDVPEAGGSKTLTVTLGRALAEGERLTVPLLFGGAATLGSDYTLAAPETAPQGVAYANLASTDKTNPPALTFTGPSAASATVILTATADSAAEGESETVTVGLGTLAATGLGGGAEGSGTVRFAILEPPPEISIAAKTASITEGADAAFTVTASRAPGADLTVRLTVSESDGPGSQSGTSSDFVAADHEGAATVTIRKGETEAAFTVATVDDTADEPDGTVTATLAGDGEKGLRYTVAAAPNDAASVAVADDDAASTLPMLSIGDVTANEKDGLMWFTVRLSKPAGKPVSVNYRTRQSTPVSAREGVDYLRAGWHLDFGPTDTEKRFWVYVYNDNHNEDPETFEVVLSRPSAGLGVADGVAVGTIVNSDPMPAAWLTRFGRTVAEQALDGIAGRMAAPRTPGAQGTVAGQAISLSTGSRQALDPGKSGNGGTGPGDTGKVVFVGPDGKALSGNGLSGNGMAGFGSQSGASLAGFDDRAGGFGPGFGGHSDRFGADGFGNAHGFGSSSGQSQTMTMQEALLGSSFTATGAKDGAGGSLAFWGRAAQGSFDGREGAFSLDGDATTAMLGADYARGNWLVGLALMQSAGEGGYRDTNPKSRATSQLCEENDNGDMDEDRVVLCKEAIREGDGSVEASLTAAVPYAALQASERLKLWGAAGYGTGEVTLKPQVGGNYRADIDWTMAAAGLRGDVIAPPKEGSGPALAVTSDALWARTSSDKTRDLAASESDVTRLRLGLEGSYRVALEEGGSITPKLEVGARHDGGDAETGFGVELGGGIAWVDPSLGLSLDLSGRTLIAHGNDDLEDRGYSASLAYDPAPATKRGPSLTLTQDWGGQAQGGLDALFTPDPLEDRTGSGEAASRWAMEAAYGLPVLGGRFTGSPHVGFGLATAARDYTIGWRLTPEAASAPDLSFGLKAVRRESDAAAAEHSVGFEITARW